MGPGSSNWANDGRFPLDVANVDFGFNEAFRTVAFADPEAAMARAEELRHENLRAQSLVEVGRAFLEKIPLKPVQNEQPIRVGEDGMRKSASKPWKVLGEVLCVLCASTTKAQPA